MEVHGREICFKRNMFANCKISDMVNGDISNLSKIFSAANTESIKKSAAFICALNEGYIVSEKYENPDYKGKPLTVEEVLTLEEKDFVDLLTAAIDSYVGEKPKIESEPVKSGKKTGEGEKKSS